MTSPSQYRPDIDGLRAVAVMIVVLYHVGFAPLSGGFIGVDVFFVISGFLITRIILIELEQSGRLSYSRFYARRVRRLFPAFAATAVFSLVMAGLLFSSEEMARFAGSLVSATLSVSNIFFWLESGYFDAEAQVKPLLHTWSLSVEEQFYLIWPAMLSLLFVRLGGRWTLGAVALLCALSLAFAEIVLPLNASAAFFLLPARVVELGIGAMLVWLVRWRTLSGLWQEIVLVAGLALIALSALVYTSETPFPGFSALVPCLGAAMAIYGGQARFAGLVLRNPISVWIGKASYSIYLVHWPLIVFFIGWTYRNPTPVEAALIVAASIALGFVQYALVEQRFRHQAANVRRWLPVAGIVAAILVLPAAAMWQSGGADWRIPEERRAMTNTQWQNYERQTYCRSFSPDFPRPIFSCQNDRGAPQDIIVWGDSHAMHLVAGVSETFPDHNVLVAYMSGCVPQSGFGGYVRQYDDGRTQGCVDRNHEMLDFLADHRPSTIILSSAKRGTPEEMAGPINEVFDRLREMPQHKVVYLADFIRPERQLAACGNVPAPLISDALIVSRCQGDPEAAAEELLYNDELAELIPNFLPINDVQCPDGICSFFENNVPMYRDNHHLTTAGAIRYIGALKDELSVYLQP